MDKGYVNTWIAGYRADDLVHIDPVRWVPYNIVTGWYILAYDEHFNACFTSLLLSVIFYFFFNQSVKYITFLKVEQLFLWQSASRMEVYGNSDLLPLGWIKFVSIILFRSVALIWFGNYYKQQSQVFCYYYCCCYRCFNMRTLVRLPASITVDRDNTSGAKTTESFRSSRSNLWFRGCWLTVSHVHGDC